MFFAGAECVLSFGGGPVVDGMGLINIITSFVDTFCICFTADREQLPDPARYAACLEASFDALLNA